MSERRFAPFLVASVEITKLVAGTFRKQPWNVRYWTAMGSKYGDVITADSISLMGIELVSVNLVGSGKQMISFGSGFHDEIYEIVDEGGVINITQVKPGPMTTATMKWK